MLKSIQKKQAYGVWVTNKYIGFLKKGGQTLMNKNLFTHACPLQLKVERLKTKLVSISICPF